MKLTIKYILLFCVILLFIACSKKTTVKITATNPVTGEPHPDLKFSVTRNSAISDFDGDVIKLVQPFMVILNHQAIVIQNLKA